MKKVMVLLLILCVALTGCAQLKDKFVRKNKKEEKRTKHYYAVRDYEVRPSLELYTKRYVFWKNWHKELLLVLESGNHKKKVVSIEQEISNLISMQHMLVEEKSQQLQVLIDEMTEIEIILKTQKITMGNKVRIRRKLEALGRKIKREFSYTKMEGLISDEFRGEKDDKN